MENTRTHTHQITIVEDTRIKANMETETYSGVVGHYRIRTQSFIGAVRFMQVHCG